ncbi:hypothetical protein KY338_04450 [Candidatus Woesearchaeota archaeon]|nr:hypothetical protein [Candidatus Woesearchaeota archaeon]MBW3005768.1 hypothetical protein [Candidatus Woesearchaeota archaeon]
MELFRDIAKELGLIKYTKEEEASILFANFIADKFRAAAKIFAKKKFEEKKPIPFRKCIFQVWEKNDKMKKFWVTDPYLLENFPDICKKPISIPIGKSWGSAYAHCDIIDDEYAGISIMTGIIDESENQGQLEHNLTLVITSIYHECDHIFHHTESFPTGEFEGYLFYIMDNAEMRAFSKQLAWIYFNKFPGEKFDYEKLKNHIEQTHTSGMIQQIFRAIELLRDPQNFKSDILEKQKYIEEMILKPHPDRKITPEMLQEAFKKYLKHINSFVEFLNQAEKFK